MARFYGLKLLKRFRTSTSAPENPTTFWLTSNFSVLPFSDSARRRNRETCVIVGFAGDFAAMNVFRFAGDMMHLTSILVLLLKIYATKSCSGLYFRSSSLLLAQSDWEINLCVRVYILVIVGWLIGNAVMYFGFASWCCWVSAFSSSAFCSVTSYAYGVVGFNIFNEFNYCYASF